MLGTLRTAAGRSPHRPVERPCQVSVTYSRGLPRRGSGLPSVAALQRVPMTIKEKDLSSACPPPPPVLTRIQLALR